MHPRLPPTRSLVGSGWPRRRRRYRYQRFVSFLAFMFSITALFGTGALWAIHLGFAGMVGIQVPFAV